MSLGESLRVAGGAWPHAGGRGSTQGAAATQNFESHGATRRPPVVRGEADPKRVMGSHTCVGAESRSSDSPSRLGYLPSLGGSKA